MPVLSITVTSEVIQHANDIIQKGRGFMVLVNRSGRWELLPKVEAMLNSAILPKNYWEPTIQDVTPQGNTQDGGQQPVVRGADLSPPVENLNIGFTKLGGFGDGSK